MPPAPALIGLLGGSFDPVHNGHVALAEALLDLLHMRELRFLPAARSPLKPAATADQHRLTMIRLALTGKQRLTIDARELRRPPPSYTVDTLRAVRAELDPAQPLAFILGLDSFLELPRWKEWQALTDHAHLVVVGRPGCHPHMTPELADWLAPRLAREPAELATAAAGRVLLAEVPPHDIASRTIRAAVRDGRATTGWLDPAVRDYIDHHHLYSGEADPQ